MPPAPLGWLSSLSVVVAGKTHLALYVPLFNFGGPPKSKMSDFQKVINQIQAKHPNFVLALDPKFLRPRGSFFGGRPFILVLKG